MVKSTNYSRFSYASLREMAGDQLDLALSQVQDGAPGSALETAREAVLILEAAIPKYTTLFETQQVLPLRAKNFRGPSRVA